MALFLFFNGRRLHCFGEAASGDCVHCGGLQSECAAKRVPGLLGGSEGDFGFGVTCQSRHCQKFILLCFAVFCCSILLAVIFALMPCCLTEGAVQQSAALDPTARWLDLYNAVRNHIGQSLGICLVIIIVIGHCHGP